MEEELRVPFASVVDFSSSHDLSLLLRTTVLGLGDLISPFRTLLEVDGTLFGVF